MSILRHLVLPVCTLSFVASCASRPELLHAQVSASEPPLRSPEPEPSAPNPYAPTRSSQAGVYRWQSEKRSECPPEALSMAPAARSLFAALPEHALDGAGSAPPINPELVIAALRPALHQCFSRWLEQELDAQGSVRFTLELGCNGEVASISAENQGVDQSTLTCLFQVVAPARFAPPQAGHATVLLPVVFKNATR